MATNKKITDLAELSESELSDDDVLAIVDISEGTTNKVRKSTLAAALSGVSSIIAVSPIEVDSSIGTVTISLVSSDFVEGPASSTDNALARFDSTTGKIVQNSSAILLDSGHLGVGGTPSYELDVAGDINFTGTLRQSGTEFTSGGGLFKGDNGTTGNATNGPKDIFRINELELNTSTTITASENASATGPLTLASGVTLTVDGNLTII
jgi:hypothetical protein